MISIPDKAIKFSTSVFVYGICQDGHFKQLSINMLIMCRKIDNCNLSGPIPPEISNLSKLQILFLGNNSLVGPLPELGSLINLQQLYVTATDLYQNTGVVLQANFLLRKRIS
jgi:hypothetical protein